MISLQEITQGRHFHLVYFVSVDVFLIIGSSTSFSNMNMNEKVLVKDHLLQLNGTTPKKKHLTSITMNKFEEIEDVYKVR